MSVPPELITQTIAKAEERRAIVLLYLYPDVGNSMKILLRKLSKSLLQVMYIVLVPKAAGPDVGGHDPPGRIKGSSWNSTGWGKSQGTTQVLPSEPLKRPSGLSLGVPPDTTPGWTPLPGR